MTVLTVSVNYDGWVQLTTPEGIYHKYDYTQNYLPVGMEYDEKTGTTTHKRIFLRFSLADLPADLTIDQITQVRLIIGCYLAGGAAHLLDAHAYNTNGQTDPQPDTAQNCYDRCASGNLYFNDSTDLRATTVKYLILTGNVKQDILDAKAAVDRLSLGLHEEGDDDAYAYIYGLFSASPNIAKLEITYTTAGVSIPVMMHHYSQMTRIHRG